MAVSARSVASDPGLESASGPRSSFRWTVVALLFAATTINYIDRQVLGILAPTLQRELRWSESDYGAIVSWFSLAYGVGLLLVGRGLDRIGVRVGFSAAIIVWSFAAMAHALARTVGGFSIARAALGIGEAGNFPGAVKAVAEWFPKKERGWAVALFDSGSSIGGAIAPLLVIGLYKYFGGWRPAFIITGTLGFLWLVAWRLLYHPPESHPRIGDAEREMILRDRNELNEQDQHTNHKTRWRDLIRLPQTWAVIAARTMTDPVWFFITDWFAIYLVTKGINPEQGLLAFWIPFVAADLGNFFGGGISSWLIRRGWPVIKARKAVVVFGGLGMTLLIPTIFTSSLLALAGLFAVSTFAYAAFSTMALVLPSDLYRSESVATVSGMSGTGAGVGTIISTFLIGYVSDHYSFEPILITASFIPFLGMILVLILIRPEKTVRTMAQGDCIS